MRSSAVADVTRSVTLDDNRSTRSADYLVLSRQGTRTRFRTLWKFQSGLHVAMSNTTNARVGRETYQNDVVTLSTK